MGPRVTTTKKVTNQGAVVAEAFVLEMLPTARTKASPRGGFGCASPNAEQGLGVTVLVERGHPWWNGTRFFCRTVPV